MSSLARAVVALAVAASGLNLLAPGFVSAVARGSIAGARAGSPPARGGAGQPAAGSGAALAAAAAAISLCSAGVAAGAAARRPRQSRHQRTQMRVDRSGLTPGGPVLAYMQALMDGAEKNGESVVVTKDVMKARETIASDEAFREELSFIQNDYECSLVEKADRMCKLMGGLESTVFPKFVRFLAKKRRIMSLTDICDEYMSNLYFNQSIAPVICHTANQLSSQQVEEIKSKMKERLAVTDIKLIVEVDSSLIAGFKLAWGFTNPEDPASATQGLDYSLKRLLQDKAISKGVITTV